MLGADEGRNFAKGEVRIGWASTHNSARACLGWHQAPDFAVHTRKIAPHGQLAHEKNQALNLNFDSEDLSPAFDRVSLTFGAEQRFRVQPGSST